jgi:predicted metal-dependent hydrolase
LIGLVVYRLKVENEIINYTIAYSSRAKHKRIVVAPSGVKVVLPEGSREQEAFELIEKMKRRVYFARARIQRQDDRLRGFTDIKYVSGAKIPLLGNEIQLDVFQERRKWSRVECDGSLKVRVPGGLTSHEMEKEVKKQVEGWIKEQVLEKAWEITQIFGKTIGLLPKGLKIKAQKKLWGSCGRNHVINLNWKLGLFPRDVLEYVVAHEVCHLRHMNHSKAFWKLVGSLIPKYETHREWLRFRGSKES